LNYQPADAETVDDLEDQWVTFANGVIG